MLSRVNQLVWPFLWGSKIETVSRNTCFLPHPSGGLNIANLGLKCTSLRISSVVSSINLPEDSSYFLCKYFIGSRLALMRPEWVSLRDNLSPHASSPSPHYQKCLSDLGKLDKLHRDNTVLTTKNIYFNLLKNNSVPAASPPCVVLCPGPWVRHEGSLGQGQGFLY